jgi:4-hydroxy-2-oxoglutarate aldolase
LRGYLVQGSNGEYCYLSYEERIEMIKKVRQYASNDKLVLAGSGMESTVATVELTNAMAKAGADAAVVITPCYFKNKMTAEALLRHFTTVAGKNVFRL